MFVNIVTFPRIKKGEVAEFEKWFEISNGVYKRFDGFISRRLLKPTRGNYVAIVEHRSKDSFMAMHLSRERQRLWAEVEPLLEGSPSPRFYLVLDSRKKR